MRIGTALSLRIAASLAALQSLPPELHESAKIDGANAWQRFRYITLPWILPVVIVLLVIGLRMEGRKAVPETDFAADNAPAAASPLHHHQPAVIGRKRPGTGMSHTFIVQQSQPPPSSPTCRHRPSLHLPSPASPLYPPRAAAEKHGSATGSRYVRRH